MVSAVASDLEIIVIGWLNKNNIAFDFQSSLRGGWYQLGGAVVDFLIRDRMLAWRVMGEYYHRGVSKSGQDLIQREMLTELGWTVVDLWSSDLEDPTRREEALRLALEGQEMLK